ncbi:MAG TPA: DNA methyltransferase [Telluria sp.]|jgi:DNA modification methylase
MKPYTLIHGDCITEMAKLPENSVDAIVCDPPYGLEFMGKEWDGADGFRRSLNAADAGRDNTFGRMSKKAPEYRAGRLFQEWCEAWATEALRVLKPGGHLLAFSGTRTSHRMVCAIEDAGFEIRDSIPWIYGSGFPKSMNVSKAIDKARDDSTEGRAVGAWLKDQREGRGLKQKDVAALWPSVTGGLTGCVANWETLGKVPKWDQWLQLKAFIGFGDEMDAEVWRLNGRKGTPGNEREILSERPASGIGHNGVAFGGHADGATQKFDAGAVTDAARQWEGWGTALKPAHEPCCMARKPLAKGATVAANVLAHGTGAINIDACRVPGNESSARDGEGSVERRYSVGGDARFAMLPGPRGGDAAGRWPANIIHDGSAEVVALFPESTSGSRVAGVRKGIGFGSNAKGDGGPAIEASAGSAARFFYCAKASRADRNAGLPSGAAPAVATEATMRERENADWPERNGNHHPTVKPTDLMAYLVRLVTPPGGLVLDPFMGSGSTGKACMREGFRFVGIDMTAEYLPIARARIEHELAKATAAAELAATPAPQLDMFAAEVA